MNLILALACSDVTVTEGITVHPHHIKIAVVTFVVAAMVLDYIYMEVLLPKMKKQHKKHAFVLTCAGYALVEVIRAVPEFAEQLPKELVHIASSLDVMQLHDFVRLFVLH